MHMTLSQGLREVADLRLEQSLNHQQIQALELLAAPITEMQSLIAREVESNPALEEDFAEPAMRDDEVWLDQLLSLSQEQRYVCGSRPRHSREDEEQRDRFFESATYSPTLHEALSAELRQLDLREDLAELCELVICSLDRDGYLRTHDADLAMVAGCDMAAVGKAVTIVQTLSPAGVGARNLQERLLRLLERRQRQDSLAYRVVATALDEVARNLLPRVARRFGVSLPALQEAIAEIRGLPPHLSVEEASPLDYVTEEVEVREDEGGELHLVMRNDYLPSLRISKAYREMLTREDTPPEAREYLKRKVTSAAFLISSVLQRQTTIERIVQVIVAVQQDFFRHGPDRMKPLTMAQVAEQAGVHETTVSRAVADKYLRCRAGLFPIKHFFSSGYTSADGESVSSVAVRNAIRRLVDEEAPEHPLSDSQLAVELQQQGLLVARRTVAKYRESIGIQASNLRRSFEVA